MNMSDKPKIAILGGTGALGTGLALRWATAGFEVIVGSRQREKAVETVAELHKTLTARGIANPSVVAMDNVAAAQAGDIAVLTVPYAHHESTLATVAVALDGKILIDVTVPLMPPKVGTVQLPAEGAAAVAAQRLLGDNVRVVSAFQNVAAVYLQDEGPIDCDILVCGNSKEACAEVVGLVAAAGLRGIYAGPLANSAAAEALTSLLITINRAHKCHAGIRITGID
jgi:hypothetical protein